MRAWFLAALLCAPVTAQVVETGGATAPVAPAAGANAGVMAPGPAISVMALPAASLFAPGLSAGSAVSAFLASRPASADPAAPIPALPAAATPGEASRGVPVSARETPGPNELVPPTATAGNAVTRVAVSDRRTADGALPDGAARLDDVGRKVTSSLSEVGDLDRLVADAAAAIGRRFFDRDANRALLADAANGGESSDARASEASGGRGAGAGSLSPAGAGAEGEALRDAVASPIPSAASPGAGLAFFRIPGAWTRSPTAAGASGNSVSFERLSLEQGAGLIVRVRAAMGFGPAAPRPADAAAKTSALASFSGAHRRAPIASTEYLERRGLLESLSVAEAAASQETVSAARANGVGSAAPSVAVFAAAPARRSAFAPARTPAPLSRAPGLAWWALAVLPAALILLKEFADRL